MENGTGHIISESFIKQGLMLCPESINACLMELNFEKIRKTKKMSDEGIQGCEIGEMKCVTAQRSRGVYEGWMYRTRRSTNKRYIYSPRGKLLYFQVALS